MAKKEEVPSEFYTTLEQALEEFEPHEVFYLEYVAQQLYILLCDQTPQNPTILDLGCGHGVLTRLVQLLFNTSNVYGIDSNKKALAYAAKQYPTITFEQIERAKFPFNDNTFNIVYAHSVFHHIRKNERAQYFKELNRVLKPGGIATIIELNPCNIFTRKAFKQDPYEQGLEMVKPITIKKQLQQYGKTSVHYFGFFQQWFTSLRFLEPYLGKIPLGSLYAVLLTKKK